MVRAVVLLAEGLDEGSSLAEVVPREAGKEVVLDLELKKREERRRRKRVRRRFDGSLMLEEQET